MEIRITRKQELMSIRNEMTSVTYTKVNGRIISGSLYRPFRFVVSTFAEDLWDPETEEDLDFKDVLNDQIFCFIDSYASKDIYHQEELINACNETINRYNAIARHYC